MKNAVYMKKDWLINQHWKNGLSLREMEKKAGLGNTQTHGASIVYWMDKYNIKRRKNPKRRLDAKYDLLHDVNWLTEQYWGFDLNSIEIAKIIGCEQSAVTRSMSVLDIPCKTSTIEHYHYPDWLVEQHYDNNSSIEEMSGLTNVSSDLISKLMHIYGLPVNMQIEHTERDKNGRRWCYSCKQWLDVKEFGKCKNYTDGLQAGCKKCRKMHSLERCENNRLIAFQIYSKGTMNCEICGCEDIDILTFDHIEGGGYRHMKERNIKGQIYRWLQRNNYPDGFRVLCWNCQHSERLKQYGKYKWDRDKDYNAEKRIVAFQVYSNGEMKCALCDCDDVDVLAIDHINGEGMQHRKKIKTPIEVWLQRNNYPDGFRILCHNCNHKEYLTRRAN